MIIVLKPNVSDESIKKIEDIIISKGVQPHVSKGEIQTIIGMVGDTTRIDPKIIEVEPEVEKVMKVSELVSKPMLCLRWLRSTSTPSPVLAERRINA